MIGNPIELIREQLGHEYAELLVEITRTATLLGFGIFIVGGTVRDLILKRDLKDIDLSVTGEVSYSYYKNRQDRNRCGIC